MNEYNPHNNLQFGNGEGRAYLNCIVRHLKPWIDKNYRTLSARSNTFIGGSSMGALISFYAALEYPEVFGRIGIFSPAFWVVPEWKQDLASKASNPFIKKERFYFYAGGKESDSMVSDMNQVAAAMQQIPVADVKLVVNKEGRHNEASWKAALPAFFEWLLKGEGKKP
jgi:predicted alpha/beta superfamily hydrolase